MKFFTDITTDSSDYCLLNINKYNDRRKLNKKEIFIDPGVYELVKSNEYSHLKELHDLIFYLRPNEYISIDYPCDMNPQYTSEFVRKSIKNNRRYAFNLHYICTIQMHFGSCDSFVKEAERLRSIWEIPNKIIGIGNMCRIMRPNKFTDGVYHYICQEMQGKRVHIYGMPLAQIKKYVPMMEKRDMEVSVDSTKWTKRIHDRPPLDKKVCCTNATRDTFFLEYMKEIKRSGIPIEF